MFEALCEDLNPSLDQRWLRRGEADPDVVGVRAKAGARGDEQALVGELADEHIQWVNVIRCRGL